MMLGVLKGMLGLPKTILGMLMALVQKLLLDTWEQHALRTYGRKKGKQHPSANEIGICQNRGPTMFQQFWWLDLFFRDPPPNRALGFPVKPQNMGRGHPQKQTHPFYHPVLGKFSFSGTGRRWLERDLLWTLGPKRAEKGFDEKGSLSLGGSKRPSGS